MREKYYSEEAFSAFWIKEKNWQIGEKTHRQKIKNKTKILKNMKQWTLKFIHILAQPWKILISSIHLYKSKTNTDWC